MSEKIENNGNGYYAIQDGAGYARVYGIDIPGAGGKWFSTRDDAQRACDEWNRRREVCDA
jgi:hypothetical protein